MVPGSASKPVCRIAVLALLVTSPTSDRASTRATVAPRTANSRASAAPTTPAPITATSTVSVMCHPDRLVPPNRRVASIADRQVASRSAAQPASRTGSATVAPGRSGRPSPPRARVARSAAPSAVACGEANTSTGHPSRSACGCTSSRDRVSPPSTRSRVMGLPRSVTAAVASSATCAVMPSQTARARWERVTASVSPRNAPVASGCQYGAASPASAGTNTAPAVSSTVLPSRSRSPAASSRPTERSQPSAVPTV